MSNYSNVDLPSSVGAINTVILPGYIYRAIIRNKLNIIDSVNYAKLRAITSVNDLAELLCINSIALPYHQGSLDLSERCSSRLERQFEIHKPLTTLEKSEIQQTILPLSGSVELRSSIIKRLSANDMATDAAYMLILHNNILFVVLEDGFLKQMDELDYRLQFYQSYLKECYKVVKIHDISYSSTAFLEYVRTLQSITKREIA
jgi:hypothetical protein